MTNWSTCFFLMESIAEAKLACAERYMSKILIKLNLNREGREINIQ